MRDHPVGGVITQIATDTKTVTVRRPQVAIRVTTPDGVPLPKSKVDVGSVLWEFTPFRVVFTKETDEKGYVYLDGMLPGGYIVHAYDEGLEVQGTPASLNVDLFGKATPDNLTFKLHAAPWYYTLSVTYPAVIGVLAAAVMGKMIEVEKQYFGAHFDAVRVEGDTVEIDFHSTVESPFVLTTGILLAIFIGLGILIILGVVAWILKETYIPPAQKGKDEFIAPDGTKFSDQESLADYLKTKKDPNPYMCAYRGCNLRFPTEAEKLEHMKTFHKAEFPLTTIAIIAGIVITAIVVLPQIFGGPSVMMYPPQSREGGEKV